jgi:hypothetical protein
MDDFHALLNQADLSVRNMYATNSIRWAAFGARLSCSAHFLLCLTVVPLK